jgi:hypothetical protein
LTSKGAEANPHPTGFASNGGRHPVTGSPPPASFRNARESCPQKMDGQIMDQSVQFSTIPSKLTDFRPYLPVYDHIN